jgi:dTMP kinase
LSHQGEVQEANDLTPPRRVPGFFIAFEGIDRCGKSTQVDALRSTLLEQGLRVGHRGAPGGSLREPGGTPAGEAVRDVLLHRDHEIDPWAEALLYAAARAQLVADVVRPSLGEGWVVLCDRFVDSSLAYQGHARGLGIDRVAELNRWATGGLVPDVTVVLEVDPALAARRGGGEAPDRIEREGLAFQQRVAEGYRAVVARDRERYVVVDGARDAAAVAAEVARRVLDRLTGERPEGRDV